MKAGIRERVSAIAATEIKFSAKNSESRMMDPLRYEGWSDGEEASPVD